MQRIYSRRYFAASGTRARDADSTVYPLERHLVEESGALRSLLLSLVMLLGLTGAFSTAEGAFAMSTSVGPVRTIDQYLNAVEKVAGRHAIAIVDVAAEWCDFCGTINDEILRDPEIVELLRDFAIIRIDVTNMDSANRLLMKFLLVEGPPTLFFIDTATAREIKATRSVGWFDTKNLAARLSPFVKPGSAKQR